MVDINNKHPASIHYQNIDIQSHVYIYSNYDHVLSYPHPASIFNDDYNSDYYHIYQHNKSNYIQLNQSIQ